MIQFPCYFIIINDFNHHSEFSTVMDTIQSLLLTTINYIALLFDFFSVYSQTDVVHITDPSMILWITEEDRCKHLVLLKSK